MLCNIIEKINNNINKYILISAMSANNNIKIISPHIKYTDDFIDVNYNYSSTNVKKQNGNIYVSKIDEWIFLLLNLCPGDG